MPTLADARNFLARYAGQNNPFTDRLNFVIARLLPEANAKGTTVPLRFAVYVDNLGNRIVTTPRDIETILAGAYQSPTPNVSPTDPNWHWCGLPIPIRNGWYETSPSGPGNFIGSDYQRGIIRLPGQFTTFCDWSLPVRLRVKLEQTELNGKIIFRGRLAGQKIWTTFDGAWQEGVALTFTTGPATTAQYFDEPPYAIIKTLTKGRVLLYTLDDNAVETLVGYYDPDETNPSYTRWKVPTCSATAP
jgi:hypothetical protein